MPVNLETAQVLAPGGAVVQTAAATGATPKFFNRDLTGTGVGPRGLINDMLRPGNLTRAPLDAELLTRRKGSSGKVTTREMPFAPISRRWLESPHSAKNHWRIPLPADDDAFDLTDGYSKSPIDVLVDVDPHGAVMVNKADSEDDKRRFDLMWRLTVFVKDRAQADWPDDVHLVESNPGTTSEPFAMVTWTYSPLDDLTNLLKKATMGISATGSGTTVPPEWAEFLHEYPTYKRITRHAQAWSTDEIGLLVADHLRRLHAALAPGKDFSDDDIRLIELQLRSLESYGVPLSAYRIVYGALEEISRDRAQLEVFSRTNQNLMLNQGLVALGEIQDQLPRPSRETPVTPTVIPGAPTPTAPQQQSAFRASPQQRAAITTDEPCTLVQAAAGSGKTTVIGRRIEHLQAAGVPLSDITVLSFTNAAADNVATRFPGVNSMTSSAMVNAIYKHNFPRQEISSTNTLVNCLLAVYGKSDDVISEFARLLRATENNENGSYTELAAFISVRLTDVIAVLNHIKLVTLPLQSIVSYIAADVLSEPAGTVGRYFIVDEVQDNSVFDFIYLLRYVTKHKASLFMVGDASQTLFEFRSANPKALNALESSGVFATYQLSTNYRSVEEILLMANGSLMNIEANRFAQIQMKAHQLRQVTAASFQEAVSLKYYNTRSQKEFWGNDLPAYLSSPNSDIRQWLDARVGKGEQIALIAPLRRHAFMLQDLLRQIYPQLTTACMTSEKAEDSTVFSAFIRDHWELVEQVDHQSAAFVVWEGLINTLQPPGDKTKADALLKMVTDLRLRWWTDAQSNEAVWKSMVDAGRMSLEDYRLHLRDSMIEFETRINSVRARVVGMRNQERKAGADLASADLLTGTIHSAKGLEFPHVMVFQNYSNDMSEEDKRLYYVAFTRAQTSELIVANGKVEKAGIVEQHQQIIDELIARDASAVDASPKALLQAHAQQMAQADDADPAPQAHDEGDPPMALEPDVQDAPAAAADPSGSVSAPWMDRPVQSAPAPVQPQEPDPSDVPSESGPISAPWAQAISV